METAMTTGDVRPDQIAGATRQLANWLTRYVHAWRSNDPADIADLFTPGARYLTQPDAEPWLGREAIVAGWLARADPATGWSTRHQILGTHRFPDQGGLRGFVQGWTVYADGDQTIAFDNLWVIDLGPDGRAGSFTEWWMQRPPAEE